MRSENDWLVSWRRSAAKSGMRPNVALARRPRVRIRVDVAHRREARHAHLLLAVLSLPLPGPAPRDRRLSTSTCANPNRTRLAAQQHNLAPPQMSLAAARASRASAEDLHDALSWPGRTRLPARRVFRRLSVNEHGPAV